MIGNKLKQLRTNRNLTLREVSQLTNISISFLSDIEHDRSSLSIENLLLISKALHVTPIYFLDDCYEYHGYETIPNELLRYITSYNSWKDGDKNELLCYLKVKDTVRNNL